MTPNKGCEPQFGETVYTSKVNGARKVKFNTQVTKIKNLDPFKNFSLGGGWEDSAPTVSDVTLPSRWYIGHSKDPQSAHQCTVYIVRSHVQVKMSSVELR